MKVRPHSAVATLAATAAALALFPHSARAGQYQVLFSNGAGCAMFTASATPGYNRLVCGDQDLTITGGGVAGDPAPGSEENISTTTPPGISIVQATTDFSQSQIGSDGWGSGDFYTGGGSSWTPGAGSSPFTDVNIDSNEWGFQIECNANSSGCAQGDPADITVNAIVFTAFESQSPTVIPAAGGLFDQTGYVWNPAGDPWPISASASDPSGVCNLTTTFDGQATVLENQAPNPNAWQQCANGTWPGSVDTRQYVPTSGALPTTLQGTNAAGNTTTLPYSVEVDNDPVTVSLATPNDPNPTVWINHAVSVTSAATAGPSGVSSENCSIDGTSVSSPTSFTVDGDGAHAVSCTAANNAVDPQGQNDTGTTSETVKIDEQPPAVALEPANPADPTQVVVDAPDNESGLAGGSITIQGPHATVATPLVTSSDGSHLYANIDDQGRNGTYTIVADACDNVGNCASTSEQLQLPLRLSSASLLSFKTIQAPAVTAHARVRVGYRVKTVHGRIRVDYQVRTVVRRRHGRRVLVRVEVGGHEKRISRRVKVGGHLRRVKIVIHADRRCGQRRVRVRPHHWRVISSCRALKLRVDSHHRARFGHAVTVHGLVTTGQGVPVADAPVRIFSRPVDRGGVYRYATQATTDAAGIWVATLRGGPSRQIRAYYPGTAAVEPTTSQALLTVPARIRLSISPRVLPWSKTITVSGHLAGRYVPHDGVALRFLVHYPHSAQWTPLLALRTTAHGGFHFRWSYRAGHGVGTYPLKVATTAAETDYPYAAGSSPALKITFGRRTPRHTHHPRHRKRQ